MASVTHFVTCINTVKLGVVRDLGMLIMKQDYSRTKFHLI